MKNFDMMSANIMCGDEAICAAKSLRNPSNFDFNTLQNGDIIRFPSTIDEFNDRLIALRTNNGSPIIKLNVCVERNGYKFITSIDKNTLCRFGIDMKGNKVYPSGVVARDFQRGVSLYDAFALFIGKSVRVTKIEKIAIRAIKFGTIPENGRFHESDFYFVEKSFYSMEYVD